MIRRSKWSSEKAFVFATIAAAVGLGNIWRFPYLVGENGGAAFILAYLVVVVVMGLPLMMVEVGAGKIEQGGVVRTFRRLHKKTAWFGWLVVLLTLVILSYYLVITGWTLGYAVDSLDGRVQGFDEFTSSFAPLLWFGLVTLLAAFICFRGVRLIELLSRWLMPALVVIIVLMVGYGLTLDGAPQAMEFLFAPDFSALLSPALWALAFGQAFYSLAIGQGYLMTYGSFLPEKVNIPRATGVIAGAETVVALLAGLMLFPIIFSFGLDPAQGTELAFVTLPLAFNSIAIGPILAVVFFWLLFLAAISSCVASMQVIKTAMREEWRVSNLRAVAVMVILLLPLGVLATLSFTPLELAVFGRPILEILDMVTANQVVVVSGLVGGAIIGWVVPRRTFVNMFADKYRALASHVVIATRYLWVVVLGVLIMSVAISS